MFECPGLKLGDGGRFRVCERTNLLFVEFNTVSCSSRSTMEAGPWTGKGYSAPWMYHRVAGQYTLFEKQQLVSEFSPRQRRPSARVLQDSTNWHDAQPPPHWGPLRQEGPWGSAGKESKRTAAAASPKPRSHPRSPTYDGFPAACRREAAWGAAARTPQEPAAPACGQGPPGAAPLKLRGGGGDLPARSPPSYEAHMLLRAGQGPRKENRPRPPPYIAPPAYEAAHRTAQPQPRACRAASAAGAPTVPAEAPPRRPEAAGCGRKGGQGLESSGVPPPGRWSYLVGARTWGGRRRPPGRAEAFSTCATDWARAPPARSHTLPRVTPQRLPAPSSPARDGPVPQGARTARWGGWPGAADKGSRRGSPARQEAGRRPREPCGTPPVGARGAPPRSRAGGLMVIDATCVVIQTHYIPPARTERVRYVGRASAQQSPAATSLASPGSLEERASRILGLPLSELAFARQGGGGGQSSGSASPRRRVQGKGPVEAAAARPASALALPEWAPSSSPQGSPKLQSPNPAPEGVLPEPPDAGLVCPKADRLAGASRRVRGCAALAEAEPSCSPPGRSYVRDLREAMSRIRRHTAPDSDTDEELEKEQQPASGHFPWKGRLNDGAFSCSSSSSLESIGSNATVVPGNVKSTATLSNGLQRGWQPSPPVP